MKHHQNFMLTASVCMSLICMSLLVGCGGGSEHTSDTQNPPTEFSTQSSGNLNIKGDKVAAKNIATITSYKDSAANAYEVQHIFDRGIRYIRLQYQVAYPTSNSLLIVDITPDDHQIRSVSIASETDRMASTPLDYNCVSKTVEVHDQPNPSSKCSDNIKLNYNVNTGESDVEFTDVVLDSTSFQNSTGTDDLIYPIDPVVLNRKLFLNGVIKGQLAQAPQNFSALPKTSSSNLTLNGLPLELNYAYVDASELTFSRKSQQTDALKNKQTFFASFNQDFNTTGLAAFKVDFSLSAGIACHKSKSFSVEDLSTATASVADNKWHLKFNNFQYGGVSEDWPRLDPCPDFGTHTLNGEMSVKIPNTSLTVEPFFSTFGQNEPYQKSIDFIKFINHDIVILKSQDVSLIVKDNEIQRAKITLQSTSLALDILWTSLGIHPIYECNVTSKPCKNVVYDANNIHVTFKDTSVYMAEDKSDIIPQEMKISGQLDFMGH